MALQSEIIEREALADLYRAASEDLRLRLGFKVFDVQGAFVSVGRELPQSAIVINRVLGVTADNVEEVIGVYREAGVEKYFLQIDPEKDFEPIEGLVKARGWQKFVRGREAIPVAGSSLRVEEVGPEYGADFARIVCAAFDLGEEAEPLLALLPGRENWHVFMSFDGDTPAGAGALFVKDGYAWTDWGATALEFRGRGGQSVVLAKRIECALDLGVTEIYTCTGEDVPGDPQHSYNNIKRLGFVESYLRENYRIEWN